MFETETYTETKSRLWFIGFGQKIPVDGVREFFRPIMTILCLVLIFHMGRFAAAWTIRTAEAQGCTLDFDGIGDMTVKMDCKHDQFKPDMNSTNTTLPFKSFT